MYKDSRLGLITTVHYNNYRNRTHALIKLTKRNYYINLFTSFKNSTKKLWQAINKVSKPSTSTSNISNVINNKKIITDPLQISNAFNDFFVNIAKELESKLPPAINDPLQYLNGNFQNDMEPPQATTVDR